MIWRIGCSGYHYLDWKKVFYPEGLVQRKWFEFYSEHFNTLELNVTFYRFPRLEFLKNWYAKSPQQFSFTVKAPRLITHYKKFKDAKQLLDDFYTTVRSGLEEKLGAVLFQFPSNFTFAEERLDRIISLLEPSVQNVVEFRDHSWWQNNVMDTLRQRNITFCGMSHPALPDSVVKTTSAVYYRFHGVPMLYASLYPEPALENVVQQIAALNNIDQVYIYFNNTTGGNATKNAMQLQAICELVQ